MPYYYLPHTQKLSFAMINDRLLKLIFIPLLGITIACETGIITFKNYSIIEIVAGFIYFSFLSFCIWTGCYIIHSRLRRRYTINQNPFYKMAQVCIVSGVYGGAVTFL